MKKNGAVSKDQKHSLVLLIREMMCQINEIAALKTQGCSATLSRELLKETSLVLQEVEQPVLDLYLELLPKLINGTSYPRQVSVSESYEALIVQARKRFISKMRLDLLEESAA